ncbi:hypothetical protein GRI75_05740 [Altererythrobacter soli]|uniref:Uncharacterized protein n=1 Tax=Croceibacterium soli TaxID=1739690 RepID=A0A6I4UUJ0_9SPHN|nr:hypothetical protein [Croceibacterium soli]MXP41147.1 hypothetical protein [Croceibacterium soli]
MKKLSIAAAFLLGLPAVAHAQEAPKMECCEKMKEGCDCCEKHEGHEGHEGHGEAEQAPAAPHAH